MPLTPLCRFRDISPSRGEIDGCGAVRSTFAQIAALLAPNFRPDALSLAHKPPYPIRMPETPGQNGDLHWIFFISRSV